MTFPPSDPAVCLANLKSTGEPIPPPPGTLLVAKRLSRVPGRLTTIKAESVLRLSQFPQYPLGPRLAGNIPAGRTKGGHRAVGRDPLARVGSGTQDVIVLPVLGTRLLAMILVRRPSSVRLPLIPAPPGTFRG